MIEPRTRGMGVTSKRPPKRHRTKFKVTLGWLAVTVKAYGPNDAIKKARKAFCDDWPRHWDQIHAVHDTAFDVKVIA